MKRFNPRVHLPGLFTSLFREAVWRINTAEPVVFLTFDDGPVPEITPWVLDLLQEENMKATFFCVGENVQKHPGVYRRILDEGHSVGNHTFNHVQGFRKTNQEYFANIEKAARLIDSDLFRPPHGRIKATQYHHLKRKFRIVMWDVVSCDYDARLAPEEVFRNIRHFVRPGSIITFHDSVKAERNLKEVLPQAIRWIKEQGYRFEAIPQQKPANTI